MTTRRLIGRAAYAALALTALTAHVAAQAPAAAAAKLTIAGDVAKPLSLTPDDLKSLPLGRVEVKTEDGTVNVYEGVSVAGRRSTPVEFHNTGLYNLAGRLSYPSDSAGLYDVTRDLRDVGKFKAPTLRNIAVTAPYMHDGSVATLEEANDHYAAGGRTIVDGPYQGVGRDNPNKTDTIRGFPLTAAQRADLVAFLQSLTDEELLRDARFANPWKTAEAVR